MIVHGSNKSQKKVERLVAKRPGIFRDDPIGQNGFSAFRTASIRAPAEIERLDESHETVRGARRCTLC